MFPSTIVCVASFGRQAREHFHEKVVRVEERS